MFDYCVNEIIVSFENEVTPKRGIDLLHQLKIIFLNDCVNFILKSYLFYNVSQLLCYNN